MHNLYGFWVQEKSPRIQGPDVSSIDNWDAPPSSWIGHIQDAYPVAWSPHDVDWFFGSVDNNS